MIVCGIDEAGYGPLLGPLCVASATLEVADADVAGDLWAHLSPAVHRDPASWRASKRRGIVVCDSKKAKLPNSSKTVHPLTHLERAVAAFLHSAGHPVSTLAEVLAALGVSVRDVSNDRPSQATACAGSQTSRAIDEPWYLPTVKAEPLVGTTPDQMVLLAGSLSRTLSIAGARVVELRVIALSERVFNDRLRNMHNKAAVSFGCVAELIERVRRSEAAVASTGGREAPVVVIDRQGGRVRYSGALSSALGGAAVETVAELPERSSYRIGSQPGRGPISVVLRQEAEEVNLAVALASMAAKLVREVLMMRFNSYWGGRIADLRGTAGYTADARRWLEDAERAGFPEVRQLVRLA